MPIMESEMIPTERSDNMNNDRKHEKKLILLCLAVAAAMTLSLARQLF